MSSYGPPSQHQHPYQQRPKTPLRQYSQQQQQQYQHVPVSGPRTKCDQVIFEAMCKACEAIVGARSSSNSNSNHSSNNSNNSRFNLQIPPVVAIRSILAQNRLQLRVAPLRVDVYYQHTTPTTGDAAADQPQRELLERWCFDYSPSPPETFLQAEGLVTSDPMAQLTHVCKRIVVWLRVLYCRARLLPAQTSSTSSIGFSVYVHTDMNTDDVGELLGQNNSSSFRLLQPRGATVTTPYGTLHWKVAYATHVPVLERPHRTVRMAPSQPIPVVARGGRTLGPAAPAAAHSAPVLQQQQRPLSFAERSRQQHLQLQQQQQSGTSTADGVYGKTLDPSQLFLRSSSKHHHPDSTARKSTIAESGTIPAMPAGSLSSKLQSSPPRLPGQQQPERVLSALSLALLQAGTEDGETNSPPRTTGNMLMMSSDEEGVLVEQQPFRRAALHEVPSHWRGESEYGVAYNHSIPWQKLASSPSITPKQQQQQQPQTMAGTPPTAAFLGTSPGSTLGSPLGKSNNATTMTPPFVRPVGFLSDASVQTSAASSNTRKPSAPTITTPTLDSLRHSPFELQYTMEEQPEEVSAPLMATSMLSHHHHYHHPDTITTTTTSSSTVMPELPFAIAADPAGGGLASLHASVALSSSRLLAASTTTTTVDELQQQLQEFQAFGASLLVESSSQGSVDRGVAAAATS